MTDQGLERSADAIAKTLWSTDASQTYSLTDGVMGLAHAVGEGLKRLGLGDANTRMGAIEAHGKAILDASKTIAGAIESLAEAVRRARG